MLVACSGGSKGDGGVISGSGGSGATGSTAGGGTDGGSDATSAATDTGSDGSTGLDCNKVSAAEISASTGISGFQGPKVEDTTGTTTVLCSYEAPSSDCYVSVYYYPKVSRSTFDDKRNDLDGQNPQYPTLDATGIGDAAFAESFPISTFTVNNVWFLKGSTMVCVTGGTSLSLDQLKKVAVLVAAKL